MPRDLFDANAVSDLVKSPRGAVSRHIRAKGADKILTSVIVVAELRYGVKKRASAKLTRQVEAVLGAFDIAPFEASAADAYGDLRAALERAGTPIGAIDTFIAAHALALGCVLVTDNEREFARVPGLTVEN